MTACNCVVIWDLVTERHVWISGTIDGSCGHPLTGAPYVNPEVTE